MNIKRKRFDGGTLQDQAQSSIARKHQLGQDHGWQSAPECQVALPYEGNWLRLLYLMKQIVPGNLHYEENWCSCCVELLILLKLLTPLSMYHILQVVLRYEANRPRILYLMKQSGPRLL
ncbi:hypothetical protein SUGI_1000080 [Cryptomeria japonica]|nr:hypothetical protein SUGI_1000080 [Cryptomeria japonica]